MSKNLTWDELADLYKKKTGGRPKTKTMDSIYEWAKRQDFIGVNEDTGLYLKSNN
jgi:hypothetical protein